MARSLNKKYFGNRNIGTTGTGDDKIGGNGIASVTIGGVWSGFTQATSTVTFSAPELPGGVTATGTVTITTGAPTAVTITNKGSGYIALPTVTIADSDVGAETSGTATAVYEVDSGNVGSATKNENAIIPNAKTTSGGTSQYADIIRQVSGRRYKVKTADGTAICKLKASAVSAVGEMSILAVDSDNGTYFVTKLTAHKATLTPGTGTQFATGASVPWKFSAASAGVSVQLPNG
jgi:hypothetical protein